jgi:hypothetical protein
MDGGVGWWYVVVVNVGPCCIGLHRASWVDRLLYPSFEFPSLL